MAAIAAPMRLKGMLPPGRAVHDRGDNRGRFGGRLRLATRASHSQRKLSRDTAFRTTAERVTISPVLTLQTSAAD